LRDGVTFHNGAKFTSADVQYSFMEVLKKVHPRAPVVLGDLVAIDTPDPLTVVFHFGHPAPYLMMALSGYDAPILSKATWLTGRGRPAWRCAGVAGSYLYPCAARRSAAATGASPSHG
jgi:ABC-type transport system substrate-binding protein